MKYLIKTLKNSECYVRDYITYTNGSEETSLFYLYIWLSIRTFWLGCHSVCSQAIAVDTEAGAAVFTGDVVYKYRNIEEDIPIGWADADECRTAMDKIRKAADIVIPSHDPDILERYPDGIINL